MARISFSSFFAGDKWNVLYTEDRWTLVVEKRLANCLRSC